MKTVWVDTVTNITYNDYNEARDAVLEHLDTDDYRDALEEVISEYGISELLKGLIYPNIGVSLYDKIMNAAEQIVLNNFLIEDYEADEKDEEDENI